MYGDTTAMRRRATQLREQGTDVRALAAGLVAQLDAIRWEGRAAADLRTRIQDRATHLRGCADDHEAAADALERHLAEVDRLKDAISDAERKVRALVSDDASLAARFTPPPTGHKDWLAVTLPGL